jgi:hypothetical protein
MPNRVDIDYTHSRAIVREIGERMRASLKPEPELPARFNANRPATRARGAVTFNHSSG